MADSKNIYHEENHPTLKTVNPTICYLCDKPLSGKIDSDHIIPNHFFRSHDQHRPQLFVHHTCNNAKSQDDKFAVLELQTLCSLNPEAEADLIAFLKTADAEKPFEYLIGYKNKVRNLRLARTMYEGMREGLDFKYQGKDIISFSNSRKNTDRLFEYIKLLCKGLYMRNMPGTTPGLPTKLTRIYYEHERMSGNYEKRLGSVVNIINASSSTRFSQQWAGRVNYFGSRVAEDINKGYIFVEFYESMCILARFG